MTRKHVRVSLIDSLKVLYNQKSRVLSAGKCLVEKKTCFVQFEYSIFVVEDLYRRKMILFEIFLFNYLLHPLLVNRSSSRMFGGHRVSRRISATIIFYPGKLFMEVRTRETKFETSTAIVVLDLHIPKR